jgi:hypothetical protein
MTDRLKFWLCHTGPKLFLVAADSPKRAERTLKGSLPLWQSWWTKVKTCREDIDPVPLTLEGYRFKLSMCDAVQRERYAGPDSDIVLCVVRYD